MFGGPMNGGPHGPMMDRGPRGRMCPPPPRGGCGCAPGCLFSFILVFSIISLILGSGVSMLLALLGI